MRLRLYRIVMALAIAAVAVSAVFEFVSPGERVTTGLPSRAAESGTLRWKITKISAKSAAAEAGVRKGDVVYLLSDYVDYRRGAPPIGKPVAIRVVHPDGTSLTTTVSSRRSKAVAAESVIDRLAPILRVVTQLLMLLVAALLVWQRPDIKYSRSLSAFFVAFALQLAWNPFLFLEGSWLIAGHFLLNFSIVFALVQVMRFATSFPDHNREDLDVGHVRAWLYRLAPWFGLVMATDTTLEIGQQYFLHAYTPAFDNIWWVLWGYALVGTILALFLALTRAIGSDKQRLLYITVTFLVGFLGPIIGTLAIAFHGDYDTSIRWRLTSLVIPFGFGYAILRHRVIDIGYAVSRAVVFGLFLSVVVPALAAAEYFIENYIAGNNNASVEIPVKVFLLLTIGFGLPRILRWFDDRVDETLFRERRVAKLALRNFSHQLQFVSELDILLQLTLETIDKNAHSTGSAVYLLDEKSGRHYVARVSSFREPPPMVGENDLAVLELRAQALPVDLTATSTALRGAEAFPMMVRGSLLGFIVCGEKHRRENYTPDELFALAGLANSTGAAIDVRIANSERERAQEQVLEQQRSALEELRTYNLAYARFVPQQFLERLGKRSIVDVELGNQVQGEMTVMFSDIRSFTTLSESMSPQETFNFLNSYLSRVGPLIRKNNGLIDKYIGDAVMALFPDSADDALRTALELLRELKNYNRSRVREGSIPIDIGLGIHTGNLMLGTIGESARMDTTVISDAVNLASRMEGLTKHFGTQLVISEATLDRVGDREEYRLRPLGMLAVKGKKEGIGVYEVYDIDEPALLLHKDQTARLFDQGMTLYRSGDFNEAYERFFELTRMNADDGPAAYFRRRCAELSESGALSAGWDGVERMLSK